ncbi:hypothetical protein L1887_12183 [Cichorium endivia]|nr:hypothetical protein L1887_12183 [Cichorium endivia]
MSAPRLFSTHFPRTLLPPYVTSCKLNYICRDPKDEHVLSYWKASLDAPDKILFLKYEEVKQQPEAMVRKLAAFMSEPFTKEEDEKINMCSFEYLSNLEVNKTGVFKFGKAEAGNREFFRKGKIGDWQNYMTEEMKERIDGIIHEKLKGSGLTLGEIA